MTTNTKLNIEDLAWVFAQLDSEMFVEDPKSLRKFLLNIYLKGCQPIDLAESQEYLASLELTEADVKELLA